MTEWRLVVAKRQAPNEILIADLVSRGRISSAATRQSCGGRTRQP